MVIPGGIPEAVQKVNNMYGRIHAGGEIDESEAVFVSKLVCAELSYRYKCLLLANLSIGISDSGRSILIYLHI